MLRAASLAKLSYNMASPNPRVGCVVVKDGKIVGEGFHKEFGGVHAEINALAAAGKKAIGADLYVTLEPCSHYGKTPPCARAIIDAGVKRVFFAATDPNPLVGGKGSAALRKAGITAINFSHEDAAALNAPYFKSVKKKMPFIILKLAVSSDGKISYGDGKRKAISCKESRDFSYLLRNEVDAILVGVNTVLKDDSRLLPKPLLGKMPLRVVLDSRLRIPVNARLLGKEAVIFHSTKMSGVMKNKSAQLSSKGARLFGFRCKNGFLNLKEILRKLNSLGVNILLVEGGAKVFSSFANQGLLDLALFFISPQKIGAKGKSAFAGVERKFSLLSAARIGKDVLVEAK